MNAFISLHQTWIFPLLYSQGLTVECSPARTPSTCHAGPRSPSPSPTCPTSADGSFGKLSKTMCFTLSLLQSKLLAGKSSSYGLSQLCQSIRVVQQFDTWCISQTLFLLVKKISENRLCFIFLCPARFFLGVRGMSCCQCRTWRPSLHHVQLLQFSTLQAPLEWPGQSPSFLRTR